MQVTCSFFFKQKTAYEITYGDWSSDVCSSDLGDGNRRGFGTADVARSGGGQSDARRAEHDGAAGDRAGVVGPRDEDSVSRLPRASPRASRRGAPANTASRSAACADARVRAPQTPTAR